jgi:hypothetical protein
MLDDDVLRLYEKYWNQYKKICAQLSGSCSYIDRYWVCRQHNSGTKNVKEIGPVSCFFFLLSLLYLR